MNAPEKQPVRSGDVAKVAMRVKLLRALKQSSGSFAILAPVPIGPFAAEMVPPKWEFSLVNATELKVTGEFGFIGRSAVSGSDASQRDETTGRGNAFVSVSAVFAAIYELSEGEEITNDDLLAFVHVNALLNIYPFWREYVYNSLSRAELPTLLIPPFNPLRAGLIGRSTEEGRKATVRPEE